MKKIFNKILLAISFLSLFLFNSSSFAFAATYQIDDFAAGTQVSQADAGDTFSKIITITFFVAAILAFSYLLYGAITIITSAGEASKKTAGKDRLTYAVIGLLILAATWAIFTLVMNIAFNAESISLPNLNGTTQVN